MEAARSGALRKGLLEFVILGIVSSDMVYAGDIIRRLSGTEFEAREGTLYPLLSRMRREGWLDYQWQESASGPPRKYYRLTEAGQQELAEFRRYWTSLTDLIHELGT